MIRITSGIFLRITGIIIITTGHLELYEIILGHTAEIASVFVIFILFAEHLGYVSSLKKLVEEWVKGTPPEVTYQKLLTVEALSIRQRMIKDYEVGFIKAKYNELYPIFFQEAEEKMEDILEDASLFV